jgi:UDP-N-acetylmuramoyl-L-alanyl-D-glutamate--2,6-diaminopimelate ligase
MKNTKYAVVMNLSELLARVGIKQNFSSSPQITGVALDSRLVKTGFIFVAASGIPLAGREPLDGHDFITKALENGAVAVIGSRDLTLPVPYIQVPNPRETCALLAKEIWGRPDSQLKIIGVTGSKGKSTTVALIYHLLEQAGLHTAQMSTVAVRFAGREEHLPGHFTTPESPQVYELLHRFVQAGCTHVVMEVSSHALDLERVTGIQFEVGALINFYPDDHIDFHGSESNYFAAKAKLPARSRLAVVEHRFLARFWTQFAEFKQQQQLEYPEIDSFGSEFNWQPTRIHETAQGIKFTLKNGFDEYPLFLPMIGSFNTDNAAAAYAIGQHLGLTKQELEQGLSTFTGVPGRMQILQTEPFRVINDFAHTGASLEVAASTLRQTTQGKLILVIGAAGQRDPNRRTGIGAVAAKTVDHVIFTEEDSRTEDTNTILETMKTAFLEAGGTSFELIPDRRFAIQAAIAMVKDGDTVLLAGKGHERTLERGTEFLLWDENAEAKAALQDRADSRS